MGIQLYYHGIATLPPVARNDRKEEQGIPWKINCHPEGVERPWGSSCITTGLPRSLRSLAMTVWKGYFIKIFVDLKIICKFVGKKSDKSDDSSLKNFVAKATNNQKISTRRLSLLRSKPIPLTTLPRLIRS